MRRMRKCKLLDVVNCVLSCVTFLWAAVYGRVTSKHCDEDVIYVWPELLVVWNTRTCISARKTTQFDFWLNHHSSYISYFFITLYLLQVVWDGFWWTAAWYCEQTSREKADTPVFSNIAKSVGWVCKSWSQWSLIDKVSKPFRQLCAVFAVYKTRNYREMVMSVLSILTTKLQDWFDWNFFEYCVIEGSCKSVIRQ